MKVKFLILLVMFMLTLSLSTAALASSGEPMGSCPPSFELQHFMDHDGDHMHKHIGVDRDLNGDGYICMKKLPNDSHLHVDNSIPLP